MVSFKNSNIVKNFGFTHQNYKYFMTKSVSKVNTKINLPVEQVEFSYEVTEFINLALSGKHL